jgi:mannose-6-phosphate isomerase
MSPLYPLRFQPILRRYLWGGRRLESLGKTLGAGQDYAESWEVVDHNADQSVVLRGPLEGTTLAELVEMQGPALLGRHAPLKHFPLLFKFLDAHDRLSIQVHPDDARAAQLDPPDLGKTEAWVVLDAQPGSYLFAGLRQGIEREVLRRELARHTAELCIERIEPRPGDCFFLPAGVVHALGPGLLIAEIQQASDTTYRLYDWSRLGPDGQPRPLHVDAALEAIDYVYGPVAPQRPEPTDKDFVERLVACDKFVLDRWKLSSSATVGGDQRCHILAVLQGSVAIAGDPVAEPLVRGGVVLLPAGCGATLVTPQGDATLLDAYLP